MILTLEEAQKVKPDVTVDDLAAFEVMIRQLTNNTFQVENIRFFNFKVQDNKLIFTMPINYLKPGDTVELAYTWAVNALGDTTRKGVNDGIFTIKALDEFSITLDTDLLFDGDFPSAMLALVRYPVDIKQGVINLLIYDAAMKGKTGIRSETVSRMSTTYYDVNANDNVNGYPASYLDFINKYKKMRW